LDLAVGHKFDERGIGPGATESRFDEASHGDRHGRCANPGASRAHEQRSRPGCARTRVWRSPGRQIVGDDRRYDKFVDVTRV
jgi:hypothetical protein